MPDISYVRGAVVALSGRFYDADGVPADPTSVSCLVVRPDGVSESPSVTPESGPGTYAASYPTAGKPAGRYAFQFTGSGSIVASTPQDYFEVVADLASADACVSPKTPATGSLPYCTPSEFLLHVSQSFAGQLVDDAGGELAATQLATDGVLEEVLRRASGILESHCLRGKRYSACDLKKLLDAGGNGAAYLRGLVADIAVGLLRDRRVFDDTQPLPAVQRANETLAMLARGDAILQFAESAEAGVVGRRYLDRSDIERTGMVTGDERFWGGRSRSYRPSY